MIGNFASKVAAAFILPIYAFFVSPEALGTFDYYQTIMGIITPLAFVSIWDAILRYGLISEDLDDRSRMISTAVAFAIMAFVVIVIVVFICFSLFPQYSKTMLAVASMMTFYAFAQTWQYICRAESQTKLYAVSGVVATLVNFALILFLVCIFDLQLIGLCVSYCLGQAAVIILIEARLHSIRMVDARQIDRKILKRFLRYTWPLALNAAILAFHAGFGRILVINVLGADQAGLYTYSLKFGSIISMVGSIFSMAVIEEAILRIGSDKAKDFFTSISKGLIILLFSVGIISLPIILAFYYFIGSTAFADSSPLIPLSLANGIALTLSTAVGSVFSITDKTDHVASTSLLGCVVSVVLSCVLIQIMGTSGVLWGLVCGSICIALVRVLIGIKLVHYRFPAALFLGFIIAFSLGSLVYEYGTAYFSALYMGVFGLAVIPFFLGVKKGVTTLNHIQD